MIFLLMPSQKQNGLLISLMTILALQRRIFHLKHLRRQPIRNIAIALGKSEDAIKANLYRMRRALVAGTPGLGSLLGI